MRRNVLVVDVNAVGMIGVIRSLGKAGYTVHAIAASPDALGMHSTFVSKSDCNPPPESPDYLPWLRAYVGENEIEIIIPSEGFLHAIESAYDEFSPLLPDAVPKYVWQRCLSKVATQQRLTDVLPEEGRNIPMGGIIRNEQSIPTQDELDCCSGPYFVKADAGLARNAPDAKVIRCETAAELSEAVSSLLDGYEAVIWQAYAPGKKVGVSLWRHNGKFLAQNMTLGIHMQPWQGGMMSLRESFWHEALLEDARLKMETLEWQGVAMMEYKWDPVSDRFWLIEINARYWGYLHLDLYSNKDFPKLQVDAFFGDTPGEDLLPPGKQVACRHTVPGEIGYVMSRVRAQELTFYQKAKIVAGFFWRFLDFRTKSDLWYPGDRNLYWRSWAGFLKKLGRS